MPPIVYILGIVILLAIVVGLNEANKQREETNRKLEELSRKLRESNASK